MSAPEQSDSMDPTGPGNDIFVRARDILTGLGFEVAEKWRFGTMCDAVVSSKGEPICRVEFSSTPQRYTLNVLPLDPNAINLIVDLTGRTHHPEPMWTNEEIDHFETLFRALKVREGAIGMTDFPSDYSLKKWLALASTVALPRERGPRRSTCDEVVIRPLEAPVDRHPSKSAVSQDFVRTARLLDAGYERGIAIELAVAAARQDPKRSADGKFEDPALGWLAQSARNMLRDRRRQMDLAWNKGSWNRTLFAPMPATGTMDQPLADADMVGPIPAESEIEADVAPSPSP